MLAPRLKAGDTIAVFSPSSPVSVTAPERYRRGKRFLEEKGFRVLEGSMTGKRDGYRSGSIRERAGELNALIRNPEIKCLIAAIGGMNSNSLLPYLDYDALRDNPKIIVGYSDVTALLLGIYAQTGLVTYYGPALAASFGELPPFVEETFSYFKSIAGGEAALPFRLPTPTLWTEEFIDWNKQDRSKTGRENRLVTLRPGKARGRLMGGNLDTMLGIWGSPYMPEIREGDILLMEDSLKDAATVERSFSLLKINGIFDRVGGIILGKHELFDDCGTGRKPYEILRETAGELRCPVLAEFDCCHTHPMLTLPVGCEVELDAAGQTVTVVSPYVG